MTWLQMVIYGMVQGLTELFPVSSLGHGVILPQLAGWENVTANVQFLPLLVMLHLGTAAAIFIYFRRDWADLISSLWQKKPEKRRLLGLVIVASVPTCLVGLVLERTLQTLFVSALTAGIFLIVNGLALAWTDRRFIRARRRKRLSDITYRDGLLIGLAQVLAFIPGFSRSGMAMAMALRLGFSYESSAGFSFLVATPVILGTAVFDLPQILQEADAHMIEFGLVGGLLTGIVAFVSTAFLMHYFHDHHVRALRPFSLYALAAGCLTVVISITHVHF